MELTAENYYSPEANAEYMSVSQFKSFAGTDGKLACEAEAMAELRGEWEMKKTKENAAYLCAYICNLLGITAAEVDTYVLRHYDVTGKNCPAQMAGSGNAEWAAFKARVKEILNGGASSGNSGSSSGTNGSFPATPFQVKVLVSDLNIRSNPSMGNNVKDRPEKACSLSQR